MPVLNSASMGAMGSLLWKLNKLLLLHTEDDKAQTIRQLRDNVVNINSKLVQLSALSEPPLTVNYWMKDARELSYDMEDCIDQFIHADSDAKIARIDEISAFRTRAEEVKERYHRFKFEYVVLSCIPTVTSTVRSHCLRRASEDLNSMAQVGMEVPRNELLGWLKPNGDDDKERPLKIVSILGVEGVGKSTLAQELWRILGEEFECRAFVLASKKPNMRMILRSILLQVRPNQVPEACRVPNLIHDITNHLQDKRYFIIIDDLWAVSIWDTVSRAFPEGNCCSRILTTTTIMDVALACCGYEPDYIFKMKSLSHDHSEELFIRTVFGSGIGCPQQFHDFASEITRKCSGLPLAITCIASLVANQPETLRQWECVQSFLHENLRTNPTCREILKQVLSLCYSIIPHCLKTCLMYLSIYPENYTILKDDLVRQWIAEDFICAMEDKDIFEVARSYFDELVRLGLIQRMDISCNKELSYVVHPMVFELITHKSIEDNFITIIDYSHSTVALTEKIRRLSLHFGSATYATTPASIGSWQVRSLAFVGLLNCMPSLVNFKLVRVIIIHALDDSGDSSLILTGICVLLWLKYLQVRCNATVQLPDQIGCLKYLETLEIHAKVAAVPSDIVVLPRLLHLCLGTKTYCCRKQPLLSSSRISSDPITIFEGTIPRPPRWIGHFQHLCYLDAAMRELQMFDVDALAELWALRILSLYVRSRTAAAGDLHAKRGAFPALKYFRYMCGGVMLLTFDKETMPILGRLDIGFNAQRGGAYGNILAGIKNLLNLQEICVIIGVSFGAEESDRRAAESAFQDAIANHPCLPKFTIKRCDQLDGEYDHLEVELSSEQSELLKKQHGAQKEGLLSNDQHGVVERKPSNDIEKHAGTRDEELETQEMETTRSILLIAILSATFTYHVGLMNPPGCLLHLHNDGNEQLDGDPILLTTRCKAFFYCNFVAFVASLVAIILVQKRARLEHQALKAAITLQVFGLMGAYAAVSLRDTMSIFHSCGPIVILAGVLLLCDVAYALLLYKYNIRRREKIKQELMQTNCAVILGFMFGAVTYYPHQDTLSEAAFYFNSFSFLLLSVFLTTRLVTPNLYKGVSKCEPLIVCNAIVMRVVTTKGMPEYMQTTWYITILMLLTILFRSRVDNAGNNDEGTTDMINDTASCPTPQAEEGNGNRWDAKGIYVVFLGVLTARVTYLAGLASPSGKVWEGGGMYGNPMKHDNSRPCWYFIFFYSNAFSFVASILVLFLLLLQLLHKRCLTKVVNTVIVLDLLGLLVAYVASSSRSFKTIGCLSSLTVTVLAYFVICMMLSFFDRRKTPPAPASASEQN